MSDQASLPGTAPTTLPATAAETSPDNPWPLQLLSTFIFEDAPGGKTKFTVRWQTHNATEEEQETFDAMHDSMTQGWSGTMDQLEAYLVKAK